MALGYACGTALKFSWLRSFYLIDLNKNESDSTAVSCETTFAASKIGRKVKERHILSSSLLVSVQICLYFVNHLPLTSTV